MNIDKEIEILKTFTTVEFIMTDRKEITKNAHREISSAINNVLNELEQLQEDLTEHEKTSFEFQEENIKLRNENKDLKDKLEIQGNLTETYFKIAEKLAEQVKRDTVFYDSKGISSCDLSEEKYCKCSKHNNGATCKQCIIDWARNEVEKDE